MRELTRLEYWTQKTLPQVYEDSLSYYELLNKVITYLNDVILAQNEATAEVKKLMDWFNVLDVQEEINIKLDEMVADGTLDTIINQNIFGDLNRKINDLAVTPQMYGAKADGVTDDTAAIKAALAASKRVFFPLGDYLYKSSLVFEKHTITADKGARLLKSFDGVGVFCVGGSSYTNVENIIVEATGVYKANGVSDFGHHGIVVIGNRVHFRNMYSLYHKGNGIVFMAEPTSNSPYAASVPAYACNMNKCLVDNVYSQYNDGKGYSFEGAQDDMSVWRLNIGSYDNRKTGIYFAPNSMARNMEGYLYSESDGDNNTATDHSVYFGKVRNSIFHVYAEGQQNVNAQEIYLDVNCENLTVFSDRNNRDVNANTNTAVPCFIRKLSFEYKAKIMTVGTNAENVANPIKQIDLSPLSNKTNWFADVNYLENSDHKMFDRVYGSGQKTEYMINKTTDKAHKIDKTMMGEVDTVYGDMMRKYSYVAKGTLTAPADVAVGDVLHSEELRAYLGGAFRNSGKIEYVVASVSGSYIGVDLVFYNKPAGSLAAYEEAFRIDNGGYVTIKKLAGVGDRPLLVDSNGRLKV